MKKSQTLNDMECKVYQLLVENAMFYNEDGGCCYEEVPYKDLGLTTNQMKGYLSQLEQKGLIQSQDGYYFSHYICNWEVFTQG